MKKTKQKINDRKLGGKNTKIVKKNTKANNSTANNNWVDVYFILSILCIVSNHFLCTIAL